MISAQYECSVLDIIVICGKLLPKLKIGYRLTVIDVV